MTGAGEVVGVVLLFNPQPRVLENLAATAAQCSRLVVVPNSPGIAGDPRRDAAIEWLDHRGNSGTAGGFNRGIVHALETGREPFMLLLDQDSRLGEDMVARLVAAHTAPRADGPVIAAVGATLVEVKDRGSASPAPLDVDTLIQVESLASSGTLIGRDALRRVGLMDESLFIDAVDHEWCLRARARGFGVFRVPGAVLHHDMGDRSLTWFGRTRPLHDSPIRHYYIIRNSLLLLRRPYLSASWRVRELLLTIRRVVAYALLSRYRLRSMRLMLLGIVHGVTGVSGRLDQ